jgi:transposase
VGLSEFWLSEEQFERLRPLLPDKVRGVARVDDRRVISGIIHVVRSGGRWVDAPACRGPDRQHTYEGTPLGGRRKRGALVQAIGISRGGRNSKLHALTDGEGRPLRFLLTGGNVADCRAADALLDDLAPRTIVLADKAYDSNAIRDLIERQGAVPNIPSKANRRWKSCFSRSRSTKAETQSSACSAASRIIVASPRATTSRPQTSSARSNLVAAITWWL